MLRVAIPTDALGLDADIVELERDRLFGDWLRYSNWHGDRSTTPEHDLMARFRDQQSVDCTITPHEVKVAKQRSGDLVTFARGLGISGGLRIHIIGPQERQFCHELSVVGEIALANNSERNRFEQATGLDGSSPPTFGGLPIECVLAPAGMGDAARCLLAGTSWGYDLTKQHFRLNESACVIAYKTNAKTGAESRSRQPVGLRGAMAWPALWSLNATSFWSRALTLYRGSARHQHAVAFGAWQQELPADTKYMSATQQRRHKLSTLCGPKRRTCTIGSELECERKKLGLSRSALATQAGLSKSAISRLLNQSYGSAALVAKVRAVLFPPPVGNTFHALPQNSSAVDEGNVCSHLPSSEY